ncbi:MAG: dihydrofolate reductase [Saprospiraceae bacterium]|nr:dihydrofolate reductase [Saprospiraceae bacterium]
MVISCIVAVDKKGAIGEKGQIPWYLPADLKYFRKTTTPHHVIMGRNTYESIGKPLANRINIVITRDAYYLSTGCLIAHSIKEALSIAADHGEKEAFIIGGAQVYKQSAALWDKLYLTRVDMEAVNADVFFPEITMSDWILDKVESHEADEKNKWNYSFEIYSKK